MNARTRASRRLARPGARRNWMIAFVVGVGLLIACCALLVALWAITRSPAAVSSAVAMRDPTSATLVVAVSPEKATFFADLVRQFNERRLRTPDGKVMAVETRPLDSDAMIEAALEQPEFQAIHPDSSLWIDQLDRAYAARVGQEGELIAPRLVADTVRYAVTPIVIAAWEPVARELGWPTRAVSWRDLQQKAQADPNFKWNHASTSHASGLLATLAEFYAGAGKVRDLTIEDVQAQSTLDYVAAIERTVRYYGEGEQAVLERARAEGRSYLDAFVIQEQALVQFNLSRPPERLVAIYPLEGTLWADHPLALLERPEPSANQRRTFQALREFLRSSAVQQQVLAAGYRPADLNLPLDGKGSPLTADNGVDPRQPYTRLQLPGPAVVDVVRNVWWYTKRHTNVFLVVDTSGSMEGEKLEAARQALRVFLDQIEGDLEQVGLVEFSSRVNNIEPLAPLGENRARLQAEIDGLRARGNTALLDAVRAAYVRLRQLNDVERINAIVVMTDGRENASDTDLDELVELIERGNREGPPIVIFAIAYGDDADYELLEALARASGGQVRQGDLETIRQLYKILSSYF
jgi:Ca-activated chloride channel family protein